MKITRKLNKKEAVRTAKTQIVRKAVLKKSPALGEVDYENCTRIHLPVPKTGFGRSIPEPELVWVRIKSGNKTCGKGVIDHAPRRAKFKIGQVVSYRLYPGDIFPRFYKLCHEKNQVSALLQDFAISLQDSMTFNPRFGQTA